MKLHLAHNADLQLFSGYGAGFVAVNSVRYEKSVVVSPHAVSEWEVSGFEALTAAHFGFIEALKPEIVILGTGAAQRFPRPELLHALAATGVGVEVMDSRAACRTYNILATEGRKVVAAILSA
ncbi:MAG: Mth938-like domain-containing protein [Burkholderiales bacterium]